MPDRCESKMVDHRWPEGDRRRLIPCAIYSGHPGDHRNGTWSWPHGSTADSSLLSWGAHLLGEEDEA